MLSILNEIHYHSVIIGVLKIKPIGQSVKWDDAVQNEDTEIWPRKGIA